MLRLSLCRKKLLVFLIAINLILPIYFQASSLAATNQFDDINWCAYDAYHFALMDCRGADEIWYGDCIWEVYAFEFEMCCGMNCEWLDECMVCDDDWMFCNIDCDEAYEDSKNQCNGDQGCLDQVEQEYLMCQEMCDMNYSFCLEECRWVCIDSCMFEGAGTANPPILTLAGLAAEFGRIDCCCESCECDLDNLFCLMYFERGDGDVDGKDISTYISLVFNGYY